MGMAKTNNAFGKLQGGMAHPIESPYFPNPDQVMSPLGDPFCQVSEAHNILLRISH